MRYGKVRWEKMDPLSKFESQVALPWQFWKLGFWWVSDFMVIGRRRNELINGEGIFPLPDFVCIGAQKSGTTRWANIFRQNVNLFIPEIKELHYFDRHLGESFVSYLQHFPDLDGLTKGEFTPAYALLPMWRIRLIAELNASLKVLYFVRHPAERSWSAAKMEVALRSNRAVSEVPAGEYVRFVESAWCRAHSNYTEVLRKWNSAFGPKNLLVCSFEEMVNNPAREYRKMCQFLGVEENAPPLEQDFHEVVHAGLPGAPPEEVRVALRNLYQRKIKRWEKATGVSLPALEGWFDQSVESRPTR